MKKRYAEGGQRYDLINSGNWPENEADDYITLWERSALHLKSLFGRDFGCRHQTLVVRVWIDSHFHTSHGLLREIVGQNFCQQFIHLGHWILEFQGLAELALYGGIRGLDVAALVVVLHELIAVKLEIVKHLLPKGRSSCSTSCVFLNGIYAFPPAFSTN